MQAKSRFSATYQRTQAVPLKIANTACPVVTALAIQKPMSTTHPAKKPMMTTFSLPKGWQLELGAEYHSPGYSQNIFLTNHYLDVNAAIQKTLLRDGSLVLRITGSNLANLAYYDIDSNTGNYHILQANRFDTQRIGISLRYRFNTAASKYKGTGAGKDARDRMK